MRPINNYFQQPEVMSGVQTFPAFCLPADALLQVLRKMDYLELIALSLVSKRSTKLVKSLNLPCFRFNVHPFDPCYIDIYPKSNDYSIGLIIERNIPDDLNRLPAKVVVNVIGDGEDEEVNEEDVEDMEHEAGNYNEEMDDDDEEDGQDLSDDDEEEDEKDAQDELNDEDSDDEEDSSDEEEDEDQSEYGDFRWANQGLTIREWIHHIHSLFRSSTPFELIQHSSNANFPSLRKDLPKFEKLSIVGQDRNEKQKKTARNVLKTFAQDVKIVSLHYNPFNDAYLFQNLGISNLDKLKLEKMERVTLDDLLSINVRRTYVTTESTISIHMLNRFLKSWIRGSNPRLGEIRFEYISDIAPDVNILLKGIDHQVFQEDLEEDVDENEKRFTIRSKKGKLGFVVVFFKNFDIIIDLFVRN